MKEYDSHVANFINIIFVCLTYKISISKFELFNGIKTNYGCVGDVTVFNGESMIDNLRSNSSQGCLSTLLYAPRK